MYTIFYLALGSHVLESVLGTLLGRVSQSLASVEKSFIASAAASFGVKFLA